MRKNKNAEAVPTGTPNSLGRGSPHEGKKHSASHKNLKERLIEYETLAKKTKQQFRQLEARKKHGSDSSRYTPLTDDDPKPPSPRARPPPPRPDYYYRTVPDPQLRLPPRHEGREEAQSARRERVSAEVKMSSGRRKRAMNSQEYKKLHEKLDLIENRISEMKRNLEKKKEEKKRIMEGGMRQRAQSEEGGRERKLGLNVLITKMPELQDLRTFDTNPYSPRNSTYYVSELVKAYRDELSLPREHLLTSLHIMKLLERSRRLSEEEVARIRVHLPRRRGYEEKKTVVFDLDETLIHCKDTTAPPYDVKLPITFPTGEVIEAAINIRPYAREILRNLSQHFELIIFTASHSCYANEVIDYLDADNEWIHHRLFREHCYLTQEGLYVKDLRILGRDLNQVVLVDNAAYSYAFQLENGIPIYPYYQGRTDFELRVLEEYLMKLLTRDMRATNDSTFKLTQYKYYYTKPNKLVEDLYIHK